MRATFQVHCCNVCHKQIRHVRWNVVNPPQLSNEVLQIQIKLFPSAILFASVEGAEIPFSVPSSALSLRFCAFSLAVNILKQPRRARRPQKKGHQRDYFTRSPESVLQRRRLPLPFDSVEQRLYCSAEPNMLQFTTRSSRLNSSRSRSCPCRSHCRWHKTQCRMTRDWCASMTFKTSCCATANAVVTTPPLKAPTGKPGMLHKLRLVPCMGNFLQCGGKFSR